MSCGVGDALGLCLFRRWWRTHAPAATRAVPDPRVWLWVSDASICAPSVGASPVAVDLAATSGVGGSISAGGGGGRGAACRVSVAGCEVWGGVASEAGRQERLEGGRTPDDAD